jgi:hypothetical protein
MVSPELFICVFSHPRPDFAAQTNYFVLSLGIDDLNLVSGLVPQHMWTKQSPRVAHYTYTFLLYVY